MSRSFKVFGINHGSRLDDITQENGYHPESMARKNFWSEK